MIQAPAVLSSPDRLTADQQDKQLAEYVMERMAVSEKYDRPFKEAALYHWKLINNALPEDWPFWSRHFEPETQNACMDTVEGIMGPIFSKGEVFDLEPVEEADELQTEIMRVLMKYVLREKAKYKLACYYECQEATFFGNGVQRIFPEMRTIRNMKRQMQMAGGPFQVGLGMEAIAQSTTELWPKIKTVSRFDCYPAPTGATIQEMPYFIERMIIPLNQLQHKGKLHGYRNMDKVKGWYSMDRQAGTVRGDISEKQFDLYERLAAVGYDVADGNVSEGGNNVVQYVEVLAYWEAPPEGVGGHRMILLANREHVIKEWQENPYHHGQKPYAEIKFMPRDSATWQAKGVPELVKGLQEKLNARTAQLSDIIEIQRNPHTLVEDSAGVQNLAELLPWPGGITRVKSIGGIQYREHPAASRELFMDIDYTRQGIQRAGGSPDFAAGMSGRAQEQVTGLNTATGVKALLTASNQAKSFKWLMAEETGIADGLNMIASLTQQVLTAPTKVRIIGENKLLNEAGATQFLEVDPRDIACQWNFYAVGSSRATDDATKAQLMLQLLASLAQLPEYAQRIKQVDLANEIAELSGIRNPQRLLMSDEEMQQKQQQDNGAQQQAQMAVALEIIKSLDYRDCPPSIQRQIEQLAGLQPATEETQFAHVERAQKLLRGSQPNQPGMRQRI